MHKAVERCYWSIPGKGKKDQRMKKKKIEQKAGQVLRTTKNTTGVDNKTTPTPRQEKVKNQASHLKNSRFGSFNLHPQTDQAQKLNQVLQSERAVNVHEIDAYQ